MALDDTKTKIPCTVAFLTWNSEQYLQRTLESVRDFAEIIFIDGGSTDKTLEIAKEHGVKIVSQSNPGHPITDFGKERQIGLDASTYDWHLWLDSDDVVSKELAEKIREITTGEDTGVATYWIKMARVHPETLKEYKTYFKTYQPRLCKKVHGAHFTRTMHEQITYDHEVPIAHLEEPWLILLNDLWFDFTRYKKRAWQRNLNKINASKEPLTFKRFMKVGFTKPLTEMSKHIIRMILNKLAHGRDAMPASYELFKAYYNWVGMRIYWSQFLGRDLEKVD